MVVVFTCLYPLLWFCNWHAECWVLLWLKLHTEITSCREREVCHRFSTQSVALRLWRFLKVCCVELAFLASSQTFFNECWEVWLGKLGGFCESLMKYVILYLWIDVYFLLTVCLRRNTDTRAFSQTVSQSCFSVRNVTTNAVGLSYFLPIAQIKIAHPLKNSLLACYGVKIFLTLSQVSVLVACFLKKKKKQWWKWKELLRRSPYAAWWRSPYLCLPAPCRLPVFFFKFSF